MMTTGFGRRVTEPRRPGLVLVGDMAAESPAPIADLGPLGELKERVRTVLMTRIDPTVAGRIPRAALRVEIAKLDGGGMRTLGIPTTRDRFVQQAVLQVLQRQWDPTFSEHSYGFRPGRSAHQAVAQAQKNIAEGYSWVVDLDLEKFLDMASYCPQIHEVLSNRFG